MKIKICGMKYPENIEDVASYSPDYMGFIFYDQSPRFVDYSSRESILRLASSIKKVGVFVNSEFDYVIKIARDFTLDVIQLHGNESPEFCARIQREGFQVIKVFALHTTFNFSQLEDYEAHCDYFLFDTPSPLLGGSGKHFNWKHLEKYSLKNPFLLSGGLGPNDIEMINQLNHSNLFALDFNSQLETSPAYKSLEILEKTIINIKKYTHVST